MKFVFAHRLLLASSLFVTTQHTVLESEANADYVLGPGDVLSIKNKNDDGTVSKAPILPDGTAVINYAGVIEASGKTIQLYRIATPEDKSRYYSSPDLRPSLRYNKRPETHP